ncbi:MAG: dihydrolipoyl dehydrogenase [Candidatus Izemoplasmataceae bacterium]
MKSHDLTIIGSGPGGYVAAIKAAQLGLDTAIIEKEAIGGVCLNWGCIPTKALLQSSKLYKDILDAKTFGVNVDTKSVSPDLDKMVKRKDKIVKKLTGGVGFLFKKNGVTVYNGEASVKDAHNIAVGDETIQTKHLIIATGAHPAVPPIEGLEDGLEKGFVHTSKTMLDVKEIPKKLTIIGGGIIGMEFATIYSTLGTEVTILEKMDDILIGVDTEIKEAYKKTLKKIKNLTIVSGADVSKVEKSSIAYALSGEKKSVEHDAVLLSTGMKPNLNGLEALDLEKEKGFIKTDASLRTNVKDVYAIGDVNGKHMLAHVASKEGIVAVETILGHDKKVDYTKVPSGIYTFPEIAQVGMTEAEAKEKGIDYKVSTFPISANGKALAEGQSTGMVKMLAETKYNEIIGVHILSDHATELISESVLGMTLEARAEDFAEAIHPHPTLSEMMHETAHGIVDKPIHI